MTGAYWYKIDTENEVFYFQYNVCQDKYTADGSDDLPSFREFSDSMINYMKDNEDKFDKIVIDLRNNDGGNATLFHNFINNNLEYLSQKKIKVLTNKHTFSSGVAAVNDLYENFNIKSYGSESGGLIGGYTNSEGIYLKNTQSWIFYSTETTGYNALLKRQDNEFEGFIPDVIIEDSVEDFRNGIDKVYDTAVK